MESIRNTAILQRNLTFCAHSEKTEKETCFALNQLYIELKTESLFTSTSNVLSFKFKCLTAIYCIVKFIP